ncbi:MAG: NADH-quinone oxidoreductase subunit J [Ardenticatenales bacterium]|nr:NADH-quinone oxidoreductase subunit J [Ardenticatenales bacterium]
MDALFFYLIAIVAVASALAMIFGRNATHSVLLMVVNFAMVAMLYLTLGAPFLAAVQILVYAGAILILFLFVVMLMGNDPGPLWEQLRIQRPAGLLFTVLLIAGLVPVATMANVTGGQALAPLSDDPKVLAESLYSSYLLPFEVTSLILLVALVGAVVLAKRSAYRTEREEELHLDEV